jgi:hypothetical protein
LGELSPSAQLLVEALALAPLERWLPRNAQGRPRKKRTALAAAFLAKSIYGFRHTRQLIEQLKTNQQLRRCCGWRHPSQVPHESCFSRAFAELARTNLAQQLHATLIQKTPGTRLVGHISRDSTAIAVRERRSEKTKKAQAQKAKRKTRRKARKTRASQRGTLIERQHHISLTQMLATLPVGCVRAARRMGRCPNARVYEFERWDGHQHQHVRSRGTYWGSSTAALPWAGGLLYTSHALCSD